MTPTALYQALVRALEARLPPRVVSRLLREGMAPAGVAPEDVGIDAARSVLRGPVFRHLQTMGRSPDAARAIVGELEAEVEQAAAARAAAAATPVGAPIPDATATGRSGADGEPGTEADRDASRSIDELNHALRPFNLYFSWPEVRKLRSLVQLAQAELAERRDPAALVAEATDQLQLVRHKLEDQLVLQARNLADLEAALAAVEPLGSPAVRRLDALIATVREAQDRRTLAEAEVERAEKLARELRKLVESTVLDEPRALPDLGRGDGRPRAPGRDASAPPTRPARGDDGEPAVPPRTPEGPAAPAAGLDPETEDRLRALDLEGEARDVEALATRHAELLRHDPALAQELADLRTEHAAGRVLGERLAGVEDRWRARSEAHRQALRREMDALRAEWEDMPPEVDATDLRRAWTVVHDVLVDALPAAEDVAAVRDLHAAATAHRDRLEDERRDRDARRADRSAQVEAARERLRAARAAAPDAPALWAARARLDEALASLAESEPPAAALEAAIDAEASWQRALADATDDRAAHRTARLRELGARLAQIPDLAALRARLAALREQTVGVDDGVDEQRLETLTHLVEQLTADARAAVSSRLEEVARQAGDPPPETLLRVLQAAARVLDEGAFPDMIEVEREVIATRDTRRAAIRRRYLRARQEANRLADAGVASAAALRTLVTEARAAVEGDDGGEIAVASLEERLAAVDRELRERLEGFESRLETALGAFRRVARLNNDDVAAVRRILLHLDDQRESVARVSPGLQAQLFASLGEAEGTLEHLRAALEATQAVADQLVTGGRIDDVLSAFDSLFESDGPSDPDVERDDPGGAEAPAAGAARTRADLEGVVQDLLDHADAVAAAVLATEGRLLAGRFPEGSDPRALPAAVRATVDAWRALGERVGDGTPDLVQLDVGGRPAWVAPLDDHGYALLWGRGGTPATGLGARLRDRRADLARLLDGAAPDA